MPWIRQLSIPARLRERFGEISARTDAFCARWLNDEYAELCRRMAGELARARPSPLERGEARVWAAAVVYAVGWVNFLADPAQEPHLTAAELAERSGVGQSTIALRFRDIREALDLVRLEPEWTLPSRLIDNPVVWLALVDGVPVDLRQAPRELQEAAFRQGVIPFIPYREDGEDGEDGWEGVDLPGDLGNGVGEAAGTGALVDEAMAAAREVVERMVAADPDISLEELNAALEERVAEMNRRSLPEFGGLSPEEVHGLLAADWEGPASAIVLDESLGLEELEGSALLHNARLLLALIGDAGAVRATQAGNLPMALVAAFIEGMRWGPDADESWIAERKVVKEEDLFPLHRVRVLLELAGLIKRRTGTWSLTRRGEQLRAPARAGKLFATLFRTHFRRLNLAWLDGIGPAPAFQQTIGYTLYRFTHLDAEWRGPEALAGEVLLPAVLEEVSEGPDGDRWVALMMETRFLRPLESFGLAESRELPRSPGEWIQRHEYRKTVLPDRFVAFRLQ